MIASVKYGPLIGGLQHGWMAFKVGAFEQGPSIPAADIIGKILDHPQSSKRKVVRLYGPGLAKTDAQELFSISQTLSEFGYVISILTDGNFLHPVMSTGNLPLWRIVSLGASTGWLRHACTELWYHPDKDVTIDPPMPDKVPLLFLNADKMSPEGAAAFIEKSRYIWQLMGERLLEDVPLFSPKRAKK